jgi:O-antigen/teichoic acid export membrane protein
MIPVAGLSLVLRGFSSTATLTCQRHVWVRPLVLRDVLSSFLGLIVMVVLAMQLESVWALVWGSVVGAAIGAALTYVMLPGPRPRPQWDRSAAGEIYRFGRWIFISTALTFLLQQGDTAILGALIEPRVLGFYAIAVLLSRAPLEVLNVLNSRVLFPIYSWVANEQPETLRTKLWHFRLWLLAVFLPPLWVLVIFGQQIIDLLYDPRYAAAGWMLRWLAAGTLAAVITTMTGSVLLAAGDSLRYMVLQVWRAIAILVGMAIGFHLAALPGLVAGLAIARFADYPVLAWAVRRHGVWMPGLDAVAYGVSTLIMFCGVLLMR